MTAAGETIDQVPQAARHFSAAGTRPKQATEAAEQVTKSASLASRIHGETIVLLTGDPSEHFPQTITVLVAGYGQKPE